MHATIAAADQWDRGKYSTRELQKQDYNRWVELCHEIGRFTGINRRVIPVADGQFLQYRRQLPLRDRNDIKWCRVGRGSHKLCGEWQDSSTKVTAGLNIIHHPEKPRP